LKLHSKLSAPARPRWGSLHSAPPDPLAGFKGAYC